MKGLGLGVWNDSERAVGGFIEEVPGGPRRMDVGRIGGTPGNLC